jgi:hypothetical protein
MRCTPSRYLDVGLNLDLAKKTLLVVGGVSRFQHQLQGIHAARDGMLGLVYDAIRTLRDPLQDTVISDLCTDVQNHDGPMRAHSIGTGESPSIGRPLTCHYEPKLVKRDGRRPVHLRASGCSGGLSLAVAALCLSSGAPQNRTRVQRTEPSARSRRERIRKRSSAAKGNP